MDEFAVKTGTLADHRIYYLDVVRFFSVMCVVVLHVTAQRWQYTLTAGVNEWYVYNVYNAAVRFCVPTLFMVSGALFLDPRKNTSLKKIFKKNILRIGIAFAFWSILYDAMHYFYLHDHVFNIKDFVRDFFYGENHMWFLFAIVGLYLLTPFLKLICANKKLMEYYLLLSIIFGVVIRTLQLFPVFKLTSPMTIDAHLGFVMEYTLYYVLGYCMASTAVSSKYKKAIYAFGILGIGVTIFGTIFIAKSTSISALALYGNFTPNVAMVSIAVFAVIKNHVGKKTLTEGAKKRISFLSNHSFGVYLVHMMLIVFFVKWGFNTYFIPAILAIPCLSAGVILSGYAITFLFAKIPGLKRVV
jgi:surface polysaccharide O-acyltransferase-like enzyme